MNLKTAEMCGKTNVDETFIKGLVSVIMPTFNGNRMLSDSIDSILNQTYHSLELLITDDHSDDPETISLLEHYVEKDHRVDVLFLDTNKGPGYARDKSIERARGQYIAFCDSDDLWTANKLELQIAFMNEKHTPLSYTSYIMIDENDQEVGFNMAPQTMTFAKLKHDNKIGCLTAIYDRKLLGRKYFMPFIRKRQDWGLFLAILRDSRTTACGIQQPLAYYRVRGLSVSSNKFSLVKYNIRIYEEVLGYPKWKSRMYFYCIFMPTYITKIIKRKVDSYRFVTRKSKKMC